MASRCGTAGEADRVWVARSAGGPVTTDAPGVTCYGCDERLSFVRAFKRRRCGIDESVRSHFRHVGHACGGEGVEHRAAKHALAVLPHSFFVACGGCGAEIDVSVEGKAVEEAPFGEFRVDVGFVVDGELRGAVEVLHSHPIGREKEEALTTSGIAWVEVTAAEVLRGGERLCCRRAARLRCEACRESARVSQLAKEEQQAMALAEAERRVAARVKTMGKMARLVEESERAIWREMYLTAAERTGLSVGALEAEEAAERARTGVEQLRQDEFALSAGSAQLNFGKYAGRPVSSVWREDKTYVRWLAGWTQWKELDERGRARPKPSKLGGFVGSEVRCEARELLKGSCLACFSDTGADWRNWCPACFGTA